MEPRLPDFYKLKQQFERNKEDRKIAEILMNEVQKYVNHRVDNTKDRLILSILGENTPLNRRKLGEIIFWLFSNDRSLPSLKGKTVFEYLDQEFEFKRDNTLNSKTQEAIWHAEMLNFLFFGRASALTQYFDKFGTLDERIKKMREIRDYCCRFVLPRKFKVIEPHRNKKQIRYGLNHWNVKDYYKKKPPIIDLDSVEIKVEWPEGGNIRYKEAIEEIFKKLNTPLNCIEISTIIIRNLKLDIEEYPISQIDKFIQENGEIDWDKVDKYISKARHPWISVFSPRETEEKLISEIEEVKESQFVKEWEPERYSKIELLAREFIQEIQKLKRGIEILRETVINNEQEQELPIEEIKRRLASRNIKISSPTIKTRYEKIKQIFSLYQTKILNGRDQRIFIEIIYQMLKEKFV